MTPYEQGYAAGQRNDPINPYDGRTTPGREWKQGFLNGRKSMTVTKDELRALLTGRPRP